MLHEVQHPAAVTLGEARHLLELGEPVVALGQVGAGERGFAARSQTAGVELGAAVNRQLLERLVEDLGVEVDAGQDILPGLRPSPERIEEPLQGLHLGIVALVEELVSTPVDERVHQHGPRRLAVAAGSADLLVVPLERSGQRGVDHGADVGLVDAHPEGDGRDDDLELAREEARLDAVSLLRVEPRVIGGGAELRPSSRASSSAPLRVGA